MTISDLLAELEKANPDFVPFEPYVCGMTKADVPFEHPDPCLKAAIHVYFGDLDGAHDQLQALEGNPEASYLHGIIHRREGDFWNANYWFQQGKSVSRAMGIDAETLTQRVESSREVDPQLAADVFNEWKSLVEVGLRRLGS